MNDWSHALGGRRESADRVSFATPTPARQALETTVISPLVHLGVLDVRGQGAETLLQGQTSAQVNLADGDFAPPTAFCTPKGRMLANAQLLRLAPDHYRLLLHRGLVAALATQLGKFAPFYRATLEPRDDLALIGIFGREAEALAEVRLDLIPPRPWHQAGDGTLLAVAHPGPHPRLLACLPAAEAPALWARLAEHATPVGNAVWCLEDIQAGLHWLTPAQSDLLLPQMINWEALGGISFKKGCYTGQEVVARAHFRGQVKRRMVRAQLEGEHCPAPGSPVVDETGKRHGEVLAAELDAYGQPEVLAVLGGSENDMPLEVEGQQLKRLRLPYPLERLDPETLATRARS